MTALFTLMRLARALANRAVVGVTEGFEKKMDVVGVGYKADVQGKKIVFSLGYSHPIEYAAPTGVEIISPTPTVIEVRGADKQAVGQVAADLRGFRPAEPYKGKGIRYEGEIVRRKAGKTGV